jgi:hypothetical protein
MYEEKLLRRFQAGDYFDIRLISHDVLPWQAGKHCHTETQRHAMDHLPSLTAVLWFNGTHPRFVFEVHTWKKMQLEILEKTAS